MFVFISVILQVKVKAADTIIKNAKSGIAIEMETGKVLYEYESDKKLYPAMKANFEELAQLSV